MGVYFFGRKEVNKKLPAKNKLYGVSIKVSALISHFGRDSGILVYIFSLFGLSFLKFRQKIPFLSAGVLVPVVRMISYKKRQFARRKADAFLFHSVVGNISIFGRSEPFHHIIIRFKGLQVIINSSQIFFLHSAVHMPGHDGLEIPGFHLVQNKA